MAAKISIKNLDNIHRKDKELGQAMNDVREHLSSNVTNIQTLQKDIAAIKKILGIP